jgi:hypothetical protein
MTSRLIDRTLIICVCRQPIVIQVVHGETIRITCRCGNVVIETFPPREVADRKIEIREKLSREPSSRWEALGMEFLYDELKDLEKNC